LARSRLRIDPREAKPAESKAPLAVGLAVARSPSTVIDGAWLLWMHTAIASTRPAIPLAHPPAPSKRKDIEGIVVPPASHTPSRQNTRSRAAQSRRFIASVYRSRRLRMAKWSRW
jgi:hypothetical protein